VGKTIKVDESKKSTLLNNFLYLILIDYLKFSPSPVDHHKWKSKEIKQKLRSEPVYRIWGDQLQFTVFSLIFVNNSWEGKIKFFSNCYYKVIHYSF
jgi:hypothetical protein